MTRYSRLFLSGICLLIGLVTQSVAISQDSLSDTTASPSIVLGEPTEQSLAAFKTAILTQAREIANDKSLSIKERVEARRNVLRLTLLTRNKATLEKMHQACAEQVLADGAAQSYGAIDWTKLAAFLKEMIPIILELIKLFADNSQPITRFIAYDHSFGMPIAIAYRYADDLRLAS